MRRSKGGFNIDLNKKLQEEEMKKSAEEKNKGFFGKLFSKKDAQKIEEKKEVVNVVAMPELKEEKIASPSLRMSLEREESAELDMKSAQPTADAAQQSVAQKNEMPELVVSQESRQQEEKIAPQAPPAEKFSAQETIAPINEKILMKNDENKTTQNNVTQKTESLFKNTQEDQKQNGAFNTPTPSFSDEKSKQPEVKILKEKKVPSYLILIRDVKKKSVLLYEQTKDFLQKLFVSKKMTVSRTGAQALSVSLKSEEAIITRHILGEKILILFSVIFSSIFIVILIWFFLDFQYEIMVRRIESERNRFEVKKAQVTRFAEGNDSVRERAKRLNAYSGRIIGILDHRVQMSNVFKDYIERYTLVDVYFSSMNITADGTVTLPGYARTILAFGKQINIFKEAAKNEKNKFFESYDFGGIALRDGGVSFTLTVKLKPGIVRK
ncbi:MAG: hypothetical protein HYW78_01720 [Parcubacteria group bacterium]|nr:hypothetical protein [Parcubacteria group bacterium]